MTTRFAKLLHGFSGRTGCRLHGVVELESPQCVHGLEMRDDRQSRVSVAKDLILMYGQARWLRRECDEPLK
jgi:hypothetical protein